MVPNVPGKSQSIGCRSNQGRREGKEERRNLEVEGIKVGHCRDHDVVFAARAAKPTDDKWIDSRTAFF
jgi:hypothetical protein